MLTDDKILIGKYYDVVKTQHVAPQQRSAIVQVELSEIPKGTKLNDRFRSSETVEVVTASNVKCTFLGRNEEGNKFKFQTPEMDEIELTDKEMGNANIAYLEGIKIHEIGYGVNHYLIR